MKAKFYMAMAFAAVAMLSANSVWANGPQRKSNKRHASVRDHRAPSAEMKAREKADIMRRQLRLSDSQYKKVYRLFVDEFRFMDNAMRPGMRQPMKGYTQRDVTRFMDRQDKKLQEILSVRQYSHWVKNCNYDYRFYVMR